MFIIFENDYHQVNPWIEEEEKLKQEALNKTSNDAPLSEIADPYECEPRTCILCPKRYLEEIRPSWRNPKLLAQFVSPHTGLVYGKHITGLCEFMQNEVVREVRRAQKMGE